MGYNELSSGSGNASIVRYGFGQKSREFHLHLTQSYSYSNKIKEQKELRVNGVVVWTVSRSTRANDENAENGILVNDGNIASDCGEML